MVLKVLHVGFGSAKTIPLHWLDGVRTECSILVNQTAFDANGQSDITATDAISANTS